MAGIDDVRGKLDEANSWQFVTLNEDDSATAASSASSCESSRPR